MMDNDDVKIPLPWGQWLVVPPPTHEVGSASELFRGAGRRVTRYPRIVALADEVLLEFPALTTGELERHGRQGQIRTTIRWMPELHTEQYARDHIATKHALELDEHGVAITETGPFRVLVLDLAEQGWAPGDEWVYLWPGDPALGALLFDPTHWLRYDWSRMRIG